MLLSVLEDQGQGLSSRADGSVGGAGGSGVESGEAGREVLERRLDLIGMKVSTIDFARMMDDPAPPQMVF